MKPKYQKNFSQIAPIVMDSAYKKPKVDKLLAILKDAGVISDSKKGIAVDIGCSAGFFSQALVPYFNVVIGLDIDFDALKNARSQSQQSEVSYLIGDSQLLPLTDSSVDLILCNHVYEHVPDSRQLFTEIHRVLAKNGACYFGAVSRFTIVEPHYNLLFLSWLPKKLANLYMRIAGKGDYYYENLRTYHGICALLDKFRIEDYTLKIISDPDKYSAQDLLPEGGILRRIPGIVWRIFYYVLPSYIFILRKKNK